MLAVKESIKISPLPLPPIIVNVFPLPPSVSEYGVADPAWFTRTVGGVTVAPARRNARAIENACEYVRPDASSALIVNEVPVADTVNSPNNAPVPASNVIPAGSDPALTLKEYGGNFGGPVGKRASFFADVRRDATDNSSILNGVSLDPVTLAATPFNGFYVVPQRMIRGSARFDIQLSTNNTLTGRYAVNDMDIPGAGIGSFSLASRGYDVKTTTHTVQLSDTTVIGSTAVNEVRFQYFYLSARDKVFTTGSTLQVAGSFGAGGSPVGNGSDVSASG